MAVTTRLTFEEFMRTPDTKPASEFRCGEAVQKPMPDWNHSTIQEYLILMLHPFLARTGLGRVLPEFRCIFGPPGDRRIFVADLVYVAKEHLPVDRYLYAAPELAIEILSPDQPMARFVDKIHFYLLHGVRLVWVIDPLGETVAVQAPGEEGRLLAAGDVLDGGDVLPGFSVQVADIFAQTRA